MSDTERQAADQRLDLLFSLRRFAEGERLAREAIGRDPDWGRGYTQLARALFPLGRHQEACDAARVGVAKAPGEPWPLLVLGVYEGAAGRPRAGLRPIREALRLCPTYTGAHAALADLLARDGRHLDALRAAERGLAVDPAYEDLLVRKGWAEYHLGRPWTALATAQDGVRRHPRSAPLHNLYGAVAFVLAQDEGWWREGVRYRRTAQREYAAAVRLDPAEPAYERNLRTAAAAAGLMAGRVLVVAGQLAAVAAVLAVEVVVGAKALAACYGLAAVAVASVVSWALLSDSVAGQLATPIAWAGFPPVARPAPERAKGRCLWAVLAALAAAPPCAALFGWASLKRP